MKSDSCFTQLTRVAERTDVAVRAGPLKCSSLVALKLGEMALTIVVVRAYLERYGEPRSIADLERRNRLGFGYAGTVDGCRFGK